MRDYHINVFYSQEDDDYIADIPDLRHCAAFGESPEEALAEVLKAKAAWIEAAKAEGKPVPPPSFKPGIYQLSEAPS
jgi:predicted RNase H-like HicB family nuclease